MRTLGLIETAIGKFEKCPGARELIDEMLGLIDPYGMGCFTAGDFAVENRANLMLYSSIPEFFGPLDAASPWWSDDPVVAWLGEGELRPFRIEDAWATALPIAAPRWQYIVDNGMGRGWTFPTSKPGFVGGVSLFYRENVEDIDMPADELALLHSLSTYFHAFMTELKPDTDQFGIIRNTLKQLPFDERHANLSRREVACLRWIAQGKTAEEIAIIDSLSVHTVRGYLKSAMTKLDSRSQAQAVARALKYGLFRV